MISGSTTDPPDATAPAISPNPQLVTEPCRWTAGLGTPLAERWPQYSALVVVHDDVVRTAELVASLSLATDLAMGLPREHGLESTIIGARLARSLGVDDDTASQVYYGSLLYG